MLPNFSKEEIMSLDLGLKGKTAVITGGAAGIGNETAEFFLKQGANVVLADLNPEVNNIAKEMGGDKAIGVAGNVCDAEYRQHVIEEGVKAFGQIDILVNCAGIVALESAEIISEDFWNRTININLSASFFMAQAVGKYMIDNGVKGSIVNIASQAGVIALNKHITYYTTKNEIIAMTKVMAIQIAATMIGVGIIPVYAPSFWKEGTRTYTIWLLQSRSPIARPADHRINVATIG